MKKTGKYSKGNGRNAGFKKHRQSLMLFCEGETEEGYFTGFRVRAKTMRGGNAITVVEDSLRWIRYYKADKKYDQLWVVFDKDESTDEEFNQAIRKAEENSLRVAYSNVSFELWILMHFEQVNSEISRKEYESLIKKHISWYRTRGKGRQQGEKLFDHISGLTNVAIKNAKDRFRKVGDHSNPEREVSSTTIFRLVKLLIERNK